MLSPRGGLDISTTAVNFELLLVYDDGGLDAEEEVVFSLSKR